MKYKSVKKSDPNGCNNFNYQFLQNETESRCIDDIDQQHRNILKKTLITICICALFAASWILFSISYQEYVGSKCDHNATGHQSDPRSQCTSIPLTSRYDCWPQIEGATQQKCEAKGCCWLPYQESNGIVPWCFYSSNYTTYTVTSLQRSDTGIKVKLQGQGSSGWPKDVKQVALDVVFETETRLNFKFYDPNNERYEVPIQLNHDKTLGSVDYDVDIPSQGPFYLTVTRRATGQILFSTKDVSPLVFSDQFIQLGTKLSSQYVYGLGEHRSRFLVSTNWTKLAFWARDQPPTRHANLYGAHPFYMNIESDYNAHGVLLLNSNAMEVELQMSPALTYRTIGGVLDFYVFTGPTPDNVVEQYTQLIGRPFMPPYWALGFHLCRWGYETTDGLKKVIQRMRDAKMPYDTQWSDIEYMRAHLDWTTQDTGGNFSGLAPVVQDLHDHGQHYIVIVDPGISSEQKPGTYPSYDDGLEQDVFIKTADGSKPIVGKVWPGKTVFPDFFHPNATSYWTKHAKAFHDQIPFDGLWTDMNEPSNFVGGSLTGCPDTQLENPPFIPAGLLGGKLLDRTLCASAKQYLSTHYNLHNLYGYSEVVATKKALDSILGKRSIVISRSSYPGTGAYGGHWTGDNNADWDNMYYSISGVMSFQLFGIPLVGADICGFNGNTNPELCARWMQLGAWYPFMRNHNTLHDIDQDPASFDVATQKIMREALELRYTLLPYLYTLFYRSHIDGTPVVRPLFFQYPVSDYNVTYMADTQFLWGTSLLITPVTSQDTTQGQGYLPKDRWYDFYNHSYIDSPGHMITFDLPKEHTNLQMKGGSIVPMQFPEVTTTLARKNKFLLFVTLSPDTSAEGELYWDDGESLDSIPEEKYNLIKFKSFKRSLSSTVVKSGFTGESMLLGEVNILGESIGPTGVTVNGHTISTYTYVNQTVVAYNLSVDLLKPFTISWLI